MKSTCKKLLESKLRASTQANCEDKNARRVVLWRFCSIDAALSNMSPQTREDGLLYLIINNDVKLKHSKTVNSHKMTNVSPNMRVISKCDRYILQNWRMVYLYLTKHKYFKDFKCLDCLADGSEIATELSILPTGVYLLHDSKLTIRITCMKKLS